MKGSSYSTVKCVMVGQQLGGLLPQTPLTKSNVFIERIKGHKARFGCCFVVQAAMPDFTVPDSVEEDVVPLILINLMLLGVP